MRLLCVLFFSLTKEKPFKSDDYLRRANELILKTAKITKLDQLPQVKKKKKNMCGPVSISPARKPIRRPFLSLSLSVLVAACKVIVRPLERLSSRAQLGSLPLPPK